MIQKLKCFFGYHDYEIIFLRHKNNASFVYMEKICKRCDLKISGVI